MDRQITVNANACCNENKSLKERICDILKWSEIEYGQFQYDMGIEFLSWYIPGDPLGADMLIRSKIFWSWWRNRWEQRDERFLSGCASQSVTNLIGAYCLIHDYKSAKLHLGRAVLDQSYAEMIGRIFDNKQEVSC